MANHYKQHSYSGGNKSRNGGPHRGHSRNESIEDRESRYERELKRDLKSEGYVDYYLRTKTQLVPEYIEGIQSFVKSVGDNISTSQLRNVFPAIKSESDFSRLARLRPQLAYISGKSDKDEQRKLIYLLDQMIVKITSPDQLKAFQYFFEAIIAYHKYYGGKS